LPSNYEDEAYAWMEEEYPDFIPIVVQFQLKSDLFPKFMFSKKNFKSWRK
jgi:hypothetical protein